MNAKRSSRAERQTSTRGFTLVELIVALAAGVLVSLAAMLLSRNATKFFQSEARISAAQLSATMGMTRLVADIQRAGFLSTPNITKDNTVCPFGGGASLPPGLAQLSSVAITQGGSYNANTAAFVQHAANGFQPDNIVIGGAMDVTEPFPVRAITTGAGAGLTIDLQTNSGPVQRMLASQATGAPQFADIFRAGRFLRLQDSEGNSEYGVISGISSVGTPPVTMQVQLTATPTPQSHLGNACGYNGLGVGVLANPVSLVKYDIRSLVADTTYGGAKGLTAPQATLSYDQWSTGTRTELVRVELGADGVTETAGTLELISEYAVDLKFGVTTATVGTTPAVNQRLVINPATTTMYTVAAPVTAGPSATPERIRSIEVRFSTRARAPDRESDIPAGPDGRKARFLLNPGDAVSPPAYARLRTLYADVSLPNQTGVLW